MSCWTNVAYAKSMMCSTRLYFSGKSMYLESCRAAPEEGGKMQPVTCAWVAKLRRKQMGVDLI